MKKIIVLALILLSLSGCTKEKDIPVNDIWDDIPEFNIADQNLDLTQFESLSSNGMYWGIGRDRDENNQPFDCVEANTRYGYLNSIFVGEPNAEIYLTFDDGYENGNTIKILDVLKEKNVKAIFFLTSLYVKANSELVRRIIDEGHDIGNHSYQHLSFAEISLEQIVEEIVTMDTMMINDFQYKMKYVRPPKGEYTEQSLAIAQALGYKTLFWSFSYYDFNVNNQPELQASLDKLVKNAHPGAIYLLHCISDTNVAILGDLIDELKEINYNVALFNK